MCEGGVCVRVVCVCVCEGGVCVGGVGRCILRLRCSVCS